MQRFGLFLSILALAVFGLGFYGCSKSESPAPATTNTSSDEASDHDDHDHGGHDHTDGDHNHGDDAGKTDMEKMEEGLSNLSDADRESAMKQHTCPVTDEMLGSMGEPIKVTIKDRELWVCCKGCKKDIMEDPDKYLAKLDK